MPFLINTHQESSAYYVGQHVSAYLFYDGLNPPPVGGTAKWELRRNGSSDVQQNTTNRETSPYHWQWLNIPLNSAGSYSIVANVQVPPHGPVYTASFNLLVLETSFAVHFMPPDFSSFLSPKVRKDALDRLISFSKDLKDFKPNSFTVENERELTQFISRRDSLVDKFPEVNDRHCEFHLLNAQLFSPLLFQNHQSPEWLDLNIWIVKSADNQWEFVDETFDRRWSNNQSKQVAINAWKNNNDYPPGTVRYRKSEADGIEEYTTFGESTLEMTANAAKDIGGWLGFAGLACMFVPVPGARFLGTALMLGAAFSSVSGATINIGERRARGQNDWDSNVWDYFEVGTCALGAAGAALRNMKRLLRVARPLIGQANRLRLFNIPVHFGDSAYTAGTYVTYGEMSVNAIGAVAMLDEELDQAVEVLETERTLPEKIGQFLMIVQRAVTAGTLLIMDIHATTRQVSNANRSNPISGLQNGERIIQEMNRSSEPALELTSPRAEGNSGTTRHTVVVSTEQRALGRHAGNGPIQPVAERFNFGETPGGIKFHYGDVKADGTHNLSSGWNQVEGWYYTNVRFDLIEDEIDLVAAIFQYDRDTGTITGTYKNWITADEWVHVLPTKIPPNARNLASLESGNVPTLYGNSIEAHVARIVEDFTDQLLYPDKLPQHTGPDLFDFHLRDELRRRVRQVNRDVE